MNLKLILKWDILFSLSLAIIIVAMSASLCCIASVMGAYELVQGNITDTLMTIFVFALPIFAFLSFKILNRLIEKVKGIAKQPVKKAVAVIE